MERPNHSSRPEFRKRILALDMGDKRIGVALSDELHLLARSHSVIERTSRKADFEQIAAIVEEYDVGKLVAGLPIEMDGRERHLAAWVRDYVNELAGKLNLDVVFWDESFTSVQAAESLRQRGVRARDQKDWIDAVAAAFILQSYLDAQE